LPERIYLVSLLLIALSKLFLSGATSDRLEELSIMLLKRTLEINPKHGGAL
jgi:hypothetical protein